MEEILKEARFDFINNPNKQFLIAFDAEMQNRGYDFGQQIGTGYCWGRYMVIYRKKHAKSDKVYARLYLLENAIVVRLFLNQIDDHRAFIENAPDFIKSVFTSDDAHCQHCHNEVNQTCRFRKSYTIDGIHFEKCNGITFEFHQPSLYRLSGYMDLLDEFFAPRRKNNSSLVKN